MVNILTYDWKEDVSGLMDDLVALRQGKVTFFYPYDEESDEYVFVLSDKELNEQEIKAALEEKK